MVAGDAGEARKRGYASGEGAEDEGRDAVSSSGTMGRDQGTCQNMCGRVASRSGGPRCEHSRYAVVGAFVSSCVPPEHAVRI